MAKYSIGETPQLYRLIDKFYFFLPQSIKNERWWGNRGESNVFTSTKGKEIVEEVVIAASKALKGS